MIKALPLQSQIITFIQNYIESNALKEGDILPSQAVLSEMMGVSKISVREAIKTLEAKNIVEVRNGKGVYVKNYIKDSLFMQVEFKKEKESLIELLHVRNILEKEILALLIKNAEEAELDEIGKVLAVLIDKYKKGLDQTKEDMQFHSLIYKYCHSEVMYRVIMSISDMLAKFQEYPLGLKSPFTETIPLHEELYHAIRERDTKKAQAINNEILRAMLEDIKMA